MQKTQGFWDFFCTFFSLSEVWMSLGCSYTNEENDQNDEDHDDNHNENDDYNANCQISVRPLNFRIIKIVNDTKQCFAKTSMQFH